MVGSILSRMFMIRSKVRLKYGESTVQELMEAGSSTNSTCVILCQPMLFK